MLAKYWIHLAELTIAILLALAIFFSWRADQRDRAQLAAEPAATKQPLTAAHGSPPPAQSKGTGWRSRHPRRGPEAALRFRPRLQSLSSQTIRRHGQPGRRAKEDRSPHPGARPGRTNRSRRQRLAPCRPRRQMVPHRRRRWRRHIQSTLTACPEPPKSPTETPALGTSLSSWGIIRALNA